MQMTIYAIRDSKTEMYNRPFYAVAEGEAVRNFTDLVNDPTTTPGRHPADFALYRIGSYDDVSALIEGHSPVCIVTGNECLGIQETKTLEEVANG